MWKFTKDQPRLYFKFCKLAINVKARALKWCYIALVWTWTAAMQTAAMQNSTNLHLKKNANVFQYINKEYIARNKDSYEEHILKVHFKKMRTCFDTLRQGVFIARNKDSYEEHIKSALQKNADLFRYIDKKHIAGNLVSYEKYMERAIQKNADLFQYIDKKYIARNKDSYRLLYKKALDVMKQQIKDDKIRKSKVTEWLRYVNHIHGFRVFKLLDMDFLDCCYEMTTLSNPMLKMLEVILKGKSKLREVRNAVSNASEKELAKSLKTFFRDRSESTHPLDKEILSVQLDPFALPYAPYPYVECALNTLSNGGPNVKRWWELLALPRIVSFLESFLEI